ncbi:hypothetical protein [Haloquadratum walsbyi]|jgi:5-methylcytosine-specific restriction protein A|uniref:hypothetical protein n=1 Tax=Haloquadratum walsbyi TaxID=293091 RepID=UPI000AE55221|nr:hypothetical protein [Haloquadratum walsbyi]
MLVLDNNWGNVPERFIRNLAYVSSMQDNLLPISYYAGVLDSLARVQFDIQQDEGETTFTVRSSLRIRTQDDSHLTSLIGEFLEAHDIEFDIFSRQNTYNYFHVFFRKDIRKIRRLLNGESTQLIRELSFVVGPYQKHFNTKILEPPEVYRLITAIYELFFDQRLTPKWHPKPKQFASKFNISTDSLDKIDIPVGTFRDNYPVEYIAGIIDALAAFRPGIHTTSYSIGYGMTPIIRIHRGGVHPAYACAVKQFCNNTGLSSNSMGQINSLNTVIQGANAIDSFAPEVGPYMIAKKDKLAYLDKELIPRFLSGEHHSKQGLYDLLVDFQSIINTNTGEDRSSQYTPEYFEKEWEGEINPADQRAPHK